MNRFVMGALTALAGLGVAGAGMVMSGAVSVAADEPHSDTVLEFFNLARSRAVEASASGIEVPALDDEAQVRRGAGNYAAMCASCHLRPGSGPTELSEGLYPAPPNLTLAATEPAIAFWTIKHGIKASGMPAWGKSMGDAHIWDMVAFLQRMPSMSADDYMAVVAASDGHSHGGGEHMMDEHPAAAADDDHHPVGDHHGTANVASHHDAAPEPEAAPTPARKTHVHPDGKSHQH
ncbi:c-type cytochrome [Denitromonas ohlonensis]|uniref:Cytochrome c n=2 Tax=Denitromonas TaxID=139331 RepID=A0A557R478_9RHOO|nr:cytochrome c [Denitromonas ohlonensis]TVO59967.1 cytochrome c [Denitromonas ohlonensis]TVO75067.1 cytochrome c [Denitromonas ohlonensis]